MAYTKHEWERGEIITAVKLNNMEDGIEANDQNHYTKAEIDDMVGDIESLLASI